MKRDKVRRNVKKERIEKNLLTVRSCGALVQPFMAERELIQSMGNLVGQQENPHLRCSSSGTQLQSAEHIPEITSPARGLKPKRLHICTDISNSCRTPVWVCAYT